ncbi:MAG TPA: zincin-like metallopeptidase domain-containing protein [Stellaceae bacterium]|jgi:antirestriction protein ArdC|nr:zincin-like metallopeptidase domain-containing protein [Stellaceae bacterium]
MAYTRTKTAPAKLDVYEKITNTIIAALETGVRPWHKSWSNTGAVNPASISVRPRRSCGTPYKGINTIVLWCEAQAKGYSNATWMTFQQAKEHGAHVRKGETATVVVYASKFVKTEKNDAGEDVDRTVPFLKSYCVFNVEQIEGLPERFYNKAAVVASVVDAPAFERIEHVDAFVTNTAIAVGHGGDRAFYSPAHDRVQMPSFHQFDSAASYYATLAHEIVHATKHEKRLNREFGQKRWGDESYAAEELVAELGAAFLCADLGISDQPRDDHASYIASWLKVLKNDKRAVFTAASHAQAAADWLHAQQPGAIEESEEMEFAMAA